MMLMPSLACAMPVCSDKAQAAPTMEQPCPDHLPHHDSENKDKTGKLNLLQDCMGVDMQTADSVSAKKPDTQQNTISFAVLSNDSPSTWLLGATAGIRGPPHNGSNPLRSQPPILLITQRFRI